MSKDEKELSKFKISEAVKRPVTPSSAAQMAGSKKKGDQQEAPSAGFPNIEGLIEQDTLDKSALVARMEQLDELSKKGDVKQKGNAKKALSAYEHASELLDYLWSTKEALQGGGAPAAGGKKGK